MAARNVRVGDSVITKSQIPGLITSMIWAGEARQWRYGLSWTGRPDVRHHRPRHGFTRTSFVRVATARSTRVARTVFPQRLSDSPDQECHVQSCQISRPKVLRDSTL